MKWSCRLWVLVNFISSVFLLCLVLHQNYDLKEPKKLIRAPCGAFVTVTLKLRISGVLTTTWTFGSSKKRPGYRLDFRVLGLLFLMAVITEMASAAHTWGAEEERIILCNYVNREHESEVLCWRWRHKEEEEEEERVWKATLRFFCIPQNESENQSLLFQTTTMEERVTWSALRWAESQFHTDII